MKELYHYTNMEGLLAILTHKKLWLSSIYSMNDNQEIIWLKSKFKTEIDRLIKTGEYSNAHNSIFQSFITILEHPKPIPYICCFSKHNDLLSQWRAYSSDGEGENIGFSIERLNVNNKLPYMSPVTEHSLGYSDVTYDENISKFFVVRMVETLINLCENSKSEEGVPEWTIKMSELAMTCVRSAQAFKNPAFSEEQEVRFIHTPFLAKNDWFGNISDVQFRITNGSITSFFEFEFPQNSVTTITLGPKNKCSKEELQLFLSCNGYQNVEVICSNASYR